MPRASTASIPVSAAQERQREHPFSLAEICSLALSVGPCQEFAALCDCARAGEPIGTVCPAPRELGLHEPGPREGKGSLRS